MNNKTIALLSIVAIALLAGCLSQDESETVADLKKENAELKRIAALKEENEQLKEQLSQQQTESDVPVASSQDKGKSSRTTSISKLNLYTKKLPIFVERFEKIS